MPRIYKVIAENVSCSAVQDLLEIKGTALKMLRILGQGWTCADQSPAAQNIRTRGKLFGPAVTDGSGGSAPTPQKVDPGDVAATFTALANSTTQATTTGTNSEQASDSSPIAMGYAETFVKPPVVPPTSAYVFDLYAAPIAAVHLTAWVLVEEMG